MTCDAVTPGICRQMAPDCAKFPRPGTGDRPPSCTTSQPKSWRQTQHAKQPSLVPRRRLARDAHAQLHGVVERWPQLESRVTQEIEEHDLENLHRGPKELATTIARAVARRSRGAGARRAARAAGRLGPPPGCSWGRGTWALIRESCGTWFPISIRMVELDTNVGVAAVSTTLPPWGQAGCGVGWAGCFGSWNSASRHYLKIAIKGTGGRISG